MSVGREVCIALVGALVGTSALAGPASADHGFPHSPGDPDRGYELVSPPDKPAGIGVGVTYESPYSMGPSGAAVYVGDRHAVQGSYGSTVRDGPFAFANDFAFAERQGEAEGWTSHSPITHPLQSRQLTRFIWPGVATPDYERVVWQVNGQAPIFAEMATWPLSSSGVRYLTDWAGRWELLNMTDPAQVDPALTGGAFENMTEPALSDSGDVAVLSGGVHGLAGPGDPARLAWGDRLAGGSVYKSDISDALTDAFPASDVANRYELVNACTGSGGGRTRIPQQLADGTLSDQPCSAPLAGRDERLVSPFGASSQPAFYGTTRRLVHPDTVSDDGSRVFFMAPDPGVGGGGNLWARGCTAETGEATRCPAQLYVRQRNSDGSVVVRWLSRPVASMLGQQRASLLRAAIFEGASADGDKVFFRAMSPLTPDDPNNGCAGRQGAPLPCLDDTDSDLIEGPTTQSWDLYMYDLADGPDPTGPGSSLTRISAGPNGDGDCNNPQGEIGTTNPTGSVPAGSLRFVSESGDRAYFVCSAPLPGAVVPSDPGRLTSPGGGRTTTTDTNLYLYDANLPAAQQWRFVARIPRAARVGTFGAPVEHAKVCASTGAPSHSIIGMTSVGDPQFDAAESQGMGCVRGTSDGGFVTFWTPGRLTADDPADDAVDIYGYDAVSDELVRVTAPQGGPGSSYQCLPGVALQCHGDMGWTFTAGATPFLGVATDPAVAGERVAFFQSRSRLTPDDADDAFDVYEWRDGELSLLTTGSSAVNDGAVYRGNDVTGRNVYFATRDALTWQDTDAVADVYVARTGSHGVRQPPPPPVCEVLAGGCRGDGPGAVTIAAPTTSSPGGGDLAPGARRRLAVGSLGRGARRRAARTGVIRLRVRVNAPMVVRAVARARLRPGRGGARRVAAARMRFGEADTRVLRLRLRPAAMRRLRGGTRLVVRVRVGAAGSRPRTVTVPLKRGERS
jgi:hypothetical protein